MTGQRARPFLGLGLLVSAMMLVSTVFNFGAQRAEVSSHREAPLISQDPAADNTDLYAFVSPDRPDSVTIIASFYPGQDPAGGPNYYRFGEDVVYDIHIDNNGDAQDDILYRFDFASDIQNPNTFLYNTGPIEVQEDGQLGPLDDPDYNFRQFYSMYEGRGGDLTQLTEGLLMPPANVGALSTPNYEDLSNAGIYSIPTDNGDIKVFVGQTDDPFWVDLNVFDLLTLRGEDAVDSLAGFNTLTIALQIPIAELTSDGSTPTAADDAAAVIGLWSSTSRFTTTVINPDGSRVADGDLVQVSRLGMPLVNEVVAPLGAKDLFNASQPVNDAQFLGAVVDPEFARLLNAIYGIEVPPTPRDDLVAVFLTGVPGLNQPPDVVPSEMLRLNVAIPPATDETFSELGVIGGDIAGFPNGRRLQDETVKIVVRVAAGILVEGFNVEPNNALDDGVDGNDVPFRDEFPYVGVAHSGTDSPSLGGPPPGSDASADDTDADDVDATDDEDADADDEDAADEDEDATAGDALTIEMDELNDSGVSGFATLASDEDGNTVVVLELDGATGDHPAHIHRGTCNELEPNPEYPLVDVDEDGNSETTVDGVALDDLLSEPFAINVHLSAEQIGVYVTCGNIEA